MPIRLFIQEPTAKAASLGELVGIANALEAEAVRRYSLLAAEMDRRGDTATATTFRDLLAEEDSHVGAVARWAGTLGEAVPPSSAFAWRLPPELGASWDEVAGSTLLTPYRALSIAVLNEQRAFALYAYIAANAPNREIARQAEHLAREELAHAAHLRRRRRLAYRREHPEGAETVPIAVETLDDFRTLASRLERDAAEVHGRLARRLEAAGHTAAARLLAELAQQECRAAGGTQASAGEPQDGGLIDALQSLHRALEPLERMAEVYEQLAESAASEAILGAAQSALANTVARLAAISAHAEWRA